MNVLAIDTSCDDTAAAVVQDGRRMLSNIVSSQTAVHQKYGGVVPELASRKHIEAIIPVVNEALGSARLTLREVDGLAVTQGPGLVGSLLVGLSFVKSLSLATAIPFIGVNHIQGHLMAIFLEKDPPSFPFIGLVVSGGHTSVYRVDGFETYKVLGQTRDDAAGEAFDKVAKLLKLGYPGGPVIDRLSKAGDPKAVRFPRPAPGKVFLDFSFSGLKTAVVNYVKSRPEPEEGYGEDLIRGMVASFQEAVVDVLVRRSLEAVRQEKLERLVLSGGVAANSRLRQRIREEALPRGIHVSIPSPSLCTDNAAMIGVVGTEYLRKGLRSPYTLNAFSNLPL